ncbi:MMPL family transporter [Kitasatospora sp. CM 4170]|uniref:MMPL family transporter n=1 Tax=Kitasatospora aburaviensis TaxID=67265 RepID=A0ABW1F8N0_9ACTN|nr:MMPL family transporter [Kitasatospora sp. CM 4170]WNM44231.1 MMPL family transporter [Kitasatospora sp. CM 4170]
MPPSTRRPPPAAAPAANRSALRTLGEWCARHSVIVIVLWIAALAGVQAANKTVGGSYSDDFSLPGTSAQRGKDLLQAHVPAAAGTSSQVVLNDAQPLTGFQAQIGQSVAALQQLPHVLSVQSPLPPAGQPAPPGGPLATDGLTGYITVRFDTNPTELGEGYLDGVDAAVAPMRAAGVEVEYGGPLGELARPAPDDRLSEAIGFAVAIVVLLVGFGSAIAAGLPLLTALFAAVVGLGVLGLIAALSTFATVAPTLATMIGIGVGIDYALFLLTRHRQNLMDGAGPVASAGQAVATSGRAVLVSGCTVIIALSGLSVSGISFIAKLGAAAAVTVVSAVLGALTLLPALMGLIGRRMDRFSVRKPVAETGSAPGEEATGVWHRYARRVEQRPWRYLVAGVVILGVLTVPLFSIQLGHIDDGADPTTFTDRRAFDLMSDAFGPGSNGPLTVVVDQSAVPADARPALLTSLQQALTGVPNAASATPLQTSPDGAVLFGTVIPADRPQDRSTTDLVDGLSDTVLPQAVAGTGAKTYLTGTTAAQVEFLDIVSSRLLPIIAVVVGLAFLIILVVFRGLLIAVKAAVLNLLSIAASYGVVVAVFQWGWGGPALGVSGTVPIESYVPMMMFAIVFGLSMDYEIFLLSRVHEAWLRTGDSHGSVAHALEITARVISCAALIMVSVFAAFIVSDNIVIKMMGLGLAVSVLIDATVVRLLLVPAVMTLLGAAAWWTPRFLDRVLPHIDTEGESEVAAVEEERV